MPDDTVDWEKGLADCVSDIKERGLRLQGKCITPEGVASIRDVEEMDAASLAAL